MALDSSRRRDLLILAAERQERERQQGVDCSQGYLESTDAGLLFDGPRSIECFFNLRQSDGTQRPAQFSTTMLAIAVTPMDAIMFHCGNKSLQVSRVTIGDDIHAVISYDGATAMCYINGIEVGAMQPIAYTPSALFRIGDPLHITKSPVHFCRHYNYALSAKEVSALYNDGDPAGYVLPNTMKRLMPINVVGDDSFTWEGIDSPYVSIIKTSRQFTSEQFYRISITLSDYVSGIPDFKINEQGTYKIPAANGTYDFIVQVKGVPYNGIYLYAGAQNTDRRLTLTVNSVEPLGCIAEYLPQNIIISRKRDFPQVTLPISGYTQSSGVFLINSLSSTTESMNLPQANGFSGKYMRFDAVTMISLYCAYWYYYLEKRLPIKITFEYRANRTIYASQQSIAPTAPDAVAIDANEGDAQIASVTYGIGGFAYMFSAADTEAWLEMRVLAIEVVEDVCLGWLDSAKQLPLNDEYLPPLLGPIVIGDATPVNITGNNSYTWTGVDDPVYSRNITTSRRPTLGQWYRIVGSISGYKKGYPYISADTGYTEVALPRTDGTFSVLVQCKSAAPSSYYFSYRAGNRGTDRTLTITVDSIEPVVERGCDLTANGTPEIVYPESSLWYGIEYDVTKETSSCVRIGDMSLHQHLPIQSRMRGCLLDDNGKVIEYLPSADWTGTVRDGSRGQVMIEIPRHYRKHETEGNIRRTKISEYPLPGYHAVPKMYISAYEASMERSTGKLCSVANSSPDFRGGNDNAAWDGTYRSLLGRPVTANSRTAFRNAARLRNASATNEWNCLDYNAYKAVFWLYYVEYANRNCQLAFNAQKDANGFAQGGLGNGATNAPDWSGFNNYYPFVPCGYTDDLGNASGEVAYVMTKEDGNPHGTVYVNRYRGIENPFGHLWKWSDGINIQIASEADGGTSKVYVSDDPAKYNDSNYTGYTLRGLEARELGYVKELAFGEFGDIMPAVVGGGSTTYWADYHYTSIPASGVALRGVLFGGNAYYGASAGFGFAYSNYAPSATNTAAGSRLCFMPKK